MEVKTFYEQLYGQKNKVQERIETIRDWSEGPKSIKQFIFNPKRCGPKCSKS